MTEVEIIMLAREVRKAQKMYFKSRRSDDLELCRKLERNLDAVIEAYLSGIQQPELF